MHENVTEKCLRGGGQSGCQKSRIVREGKGLFVSYMKVDEGVIFEYVMELHIEKWLRLEAQFKMSRIEVLERFRASV